LTFEFVAAVIKPSCSVFRRDDRKRFAYRFYERLPCARCCFPEVSLDLLQNASSMGLRSGFRLQRDVFEEEQRLSFRMKDTRIALSTASMVSQGHIVDTQQMKSLDDDLPNYTSAESARYTVEVNRGYFRERNIEVGDKAVLPI
jgi:Uncharacterized ACR, COG1430